MSAVGRLMQVPKYPCWFTRIDWEQSVFGSPRRIRAEIEWYDNIGPQEDNPMTGILRAITAANAENPLFAWADYLEERGFLEAANELRRFRG